LPNSDGDGATAKDAGTAADGRVHLVSRDIAELLTTRSTLRTVGPYEISDDPDRVDLEVVHAFRAGVLLALDDVFVLAPHRRRGLAGALVEAAMAHPATVRQACGRWPATPERSMSSAAAAGLPPWTR
jgi:GNAT superfamily N-acetyltransferase